MTLDGAGVTLRAATKRTGGLLIGSSGNRVRGLTLEGFDVAVLIQPYWSPGGPFPTRRTVADNVVSRVVIKGAGWAGIEVLSTGAEGRCGAPPRPRCRSYNRITGLTVSGTTIEARDRGIKLYLANVGDRFEHASLTGNRIRILGKGVDAGIALETAGDSQGARISDVLVARNSIAGRAGFGINVNAGAGRGQTGTVENIRILDNRLERDFCCLGIAIQAGSEDPSQTTVAGVARYPDRNIVRNVVVRGNVISGRLSSPARVGGVGVSSGIGAGGRNNRVSNVRIERNVIRSTTVGNGVLLWLGKGVPARYATGNRIAGVTITGNLVTLGRSVPPWTDEGWHGGVVLVVGDAFARGNAMSGVRVTGNRFANVGVRVRIVRSPGNTVSCSGC